MPATPRPQEYEFRSDNTVMWFACLALIGFGGFQVSTLLHDHTVLDALAGNLFASVLSTLMIAAGMTLLARHEHRVIEVDGNERVLRARCRTLFRDEDDEIAFKAVLSIAVVTDFDVKYATRNTTLQFVLKDGRTIPTGRNWAHHEGAVDLSRDLASLIGCDRSGL